MNTKLILLKFKTDKKILYSDLLQIRGFLGNKFIENTDFHNHINNGLNYKYPSIQYKIINREFHILAINESIPMLYSILPQIKEFKINNEVLPVKEISMKNYEENIGVDNDFFVYKFISPYFVFNQENYRKFKELESQREKNDLINKILTGNILSYLKSMNIWVEEKIYVDFYMENNKVIKCKDTKVIGLEGEFATNVRLPDYIGLGKGVAKGNGIIIKTDKR